MQSNIAAIIRLLLSVFYSEWRCLIRLSRKREKEMRSRNFVCDGYKPTVKLSHKQRILPAVFYID